MTIDNTDTIEQILNYGEEKPSDLDKDSPFLSEISLPIKLLQELDEKEEISWKEKKLNSTTGLRKPKKPESDNFTQKDASSLGLHNVPYKNFNQQHFFENRREHHHTEFNPFRRERQNKFRNEDELGWNVELKDNTDGFFDSKGYFIKEVKSSRNIPEKKENRPEILWFIKKDGVLKGPFNNNEMFNQMNSINDCQIKRISDKMFINFDKLKNVKNIFKYTMDEKELNNIFKNETNRKIKEEAEKKEAKMKIEKKMKNPFVRKMEFNDMFDHLPETTIPIQTRLESCKRTERMLKKLQLNCTVEYIYNKIKDQNKQNAIDLLQKSTLILKSDVMDLIDTFLEEIGVQVVTDVDKDGFNINTMKKK